VWTFLLEYVISMTMIPSVFYCCLELCVLKDMFFMLPGIVEGTKKWCVNKVKHGVMKKKCLANLNLFV